MLLIDVPVTLALVGSALYLLGMILALLRNEYRPQAARILAIYSLLSLFWALEQALRGLGQLAFLLEAFLDLAPLYGILILAIIFLFLSRALLDSQGAGWGWLSLGLLWLAVLTLMDLGLLFIPDTLMFRGGWSLSRQALSSIVLIAGWAIFMGAATLLTVQTLRGSSRYYTTASYWALVLILTVVGDGIFFAGQPALGGVLRLVGAMLAVYVVLAHRLPDISHILRQLLVYLVFTLLAVAIYTGGIVVFQRISRDWSVLSSFGISLVLAVILALLVYPLLNRIQGVINRWVSGGDQDPTELLRQYSQSITHVLDLNLLATVAVGTASEFLEVKRGFLFLVDLEKGKNGQNEYHLRGVKGMGDTNPQPVILNEANPLTAYFRDGHEPITQYDIDFQPRFRSMDQQERKWLGGIGADIYVPIYAKNEWIGLLALGPKSSGGAYTAKDLSLLSTLADQTAVALENTRLVEGLVRLNNDFRRAYSALDQANRHLERLDKTKSDFISISSHELRTPLTLISGSSQMLLEDPELQKNPYYKQLLSKIHSGTVRLHEIVDSMLDIAKIDTRALELEQRPVSLESIIRAVCSELEKPAREREQTLEIEDNLKELPSIAADMAALRKVFHHVVINSIKYTPDGGKITISGREVEPNLTDLPKGGVEIIVSDTGIGIDPRYQELIFVKFYQTGELALHSSGKTKFKGGGPGLGLAIARGVVEAHQGKLWVESPGYDEVRCPGSKFHILLPLRQTDSPRPPSDILPPEHP
ncbi:MAG: GAF domain-containing protein [Anaerolineales bacterium]|nr:GAF domain-containing protein [Anaerolineales bacterium]